MPRVEQNVLANYETKREKLHSYPYSLWNFIKFLGILIKFQNSYSACATSTQVLCWKKHQYQRQILIPMNKLEKAK
jgi:hypothetical protein